MFPTLPESVQQEIAQLSEQYGQPLVRVVDFASEGDFEPLNKRDRYGEACMVVRRPNGKLLTMIKTHYPPTAFRLLTGGINHGESILEGLLRETAEETGLEVEVKRFLGIAAYRLPHKGEAPIFYTFAFLLDEVGGELGAIDEAEQVGEFREIEVDELRGMESTLETLGKQNPEGDWPDWGRFRAIIHQVVWEALQ